jgi:hypothetical protein
MGRPTRRRPPLLRVCCDPRVLTSSHIFYPSTSFKQEGGIPADVALFDDVARRMADAGRCWAARTTRVVDMQAYSASPAGKMRFARRGLLKTDTLSPADQ